MAPEPDRLPPHRRRPHVPLQLAVRAARRRRDPAPDREHRHEPGGGRGDLADQGVADLARDRLGRRRPLPARHGRQGPRSSPSSSSRRARRTRTRARSGSASRRTGRSPGTTPSAGTIEFRNELLPGPGDGPLGRTADLQLRLAGRRRVRRDHTRDPRRGSRLEHADADQHPARSRRRPARLRARSEHQRRGRAQAVEAAERRGARRLPQRRLHPGGTAQLPRAARVELRRQDDDHVAGTSSSSDSTSSGSCRARRRSTTRSSTG